MGSVIIHIHFRGIYLKKIKKCKNYSQYATMIIQLNINEILLRFRTKEKYFPLHHPRNPRVVFLSSERSPPKETYK